MTETAPTHGPLAGLRVIEMAGIGPAPMAAMLLADLGAEVIRVDRPGGGFMALGRADVLNRGRRSVAVNMKDPGGAGVVLRLAEQADVLIEGFRPGVAERLGIGPEDCWARNPKLVYGRMTGWGQEGPLASSAGHDIAYIAITGALSAIGRAGGPPQIPLNLIGDFGGGSLYLVLGVLAAVYEAQRSGRGQVVDAAIVDGAASLMTMPYGLHGLGVWTDERGTNLLDGGAPFYEVYETSDGRYMAVGAIEPQFYAELIRRLGLDDEDLPAQMDRNEWGTLKARFAEVFRTKTQAEWAAIFEGTEACTAPVLTMTEAPDHPHLAKRGTFVEHEGAIQPAPAPRFSRTPGQLTLPPPNAGEHTRAILTDWGIDDVDDLLAKGTVVQDG